MMAALMEIPAIENTLEHDRETTEDSTEDGLGLEDDIFFQDLDALLDHGIPSSDIQKLKKAGINTVKGVQMTTRKKLLEIKSFTEEKIFAIKEACCKVSLTSGFLTALEVSDQRKQVFKLSTGSSYLE